MWRVLICDDDAVFAKSLKSSIKTIMTDWTKEIKLFDSKEQLEFYAAEHPDEANIILLDVDLQDGNGVEAAKNVLSLQKNSQIIFVSGYDCYYLDVYEVEHVYFLRKPVEEEKLKSALERAEQKLSDVKQKRFIVSTKKGVQKIDLTDILFFEKEKRRIHIHTERNGIVTYYGKFEDMMDQLDQRFVRCHNSYIVNITKVNKLGNRKLHFDMEKEVPISKSYYTETKQVFLEYLGGGYNLEDIYMFGED